MPDLPPDVVNNLRIPHRETALQVGARTGAFPPARAPSIERFPYYTAFPYGWFAAGYAADLAVGQVQPLHRLARDLVLWRGQDGVAAVMDAHCPHRGANMAMGGEVRGCTLTCPYHWWTWDRAGTNVSIPYRDQPAGGLHIRSYPTIEISGFVLFWYHPDPACGPLWELPDLSEYSTDRWSDLAPFSVDYRCPWQEVAENYPDNLHLRIVHGVASVPTVHDVRFDGHAHSLESTFTLETDQGTIAGSMRTEAHGPGFTVMRSSGLVDSVFYLATTPIDWELTRSSMGYRILRVGSGPEAAAWERAVLDALLSELKKQWAEDVAIFDNKIHVPDLGSSPEDETTRRYRAWAEQFYVAGDPLAGGRSVTETPRQRL